MTPDNDPKVTKTTLPAEKSTIEPIRLSTEMSTAEAIKVDVDDANIDPAFRATGGTTIEISAEASARVLKKIDRHMLPLMCWIYLVQFADKSSLNYSSLMGIKADTHLTGYQYSWLGSIFYAGYIFWEYANSPSRLPIVTKLSLIID